MNFKELVIKYNKPELAQLMGSVLQVWSDGEITSQKSGELLWLRTLHRIELPLDNYKNIHAKEWPEQININSYMFTDAEGAEAVRNWLKIDI